MVLYHRGSRDEKTLNLEAHLSLVGAAGPSYLPTSNTYLLGAFDVSFLPKASCKIEFSVHQLFLTQSMEDLKDQLIEFQLPGKKNPQVWVSGYLLAEP